MQVEALEVRKNKLARDKGTYKTCLDHANAKLLKRGEELGKE